MILPKAGSRNRSGVGSQPGPARTPARAGVRVLGPAYRPGGGGGERRKVGHGRRRLVGEFGGKDHADPPVKPVEAQPAVRVVLAQQRDQPFTISVAEQGTRSTGL